MNSRISNSLRVLLIGLIIIALLAVIGVRAAHPKSGLKSALGNASSAIALYQKTKSVTKGSKVIVTTGRMQSDLALALVNNVQGDNLDIQVGTNLMRVSVKKDLHGKLIAVLPFLGYLANLLPN